MDGIVISNVNDIKYLGSIVVMDGDTDTEAGGRIQGGWRLRVLCDKRLPVSFKSLYNCCETRDALSDRGCSIQEN